MNEITLNSNIRHGLQALMRASGLCPTPPLRVGSEQSGRMWEESGSLVTSRAAGSAAQRELK